MHILLAGHSTVFAVMQPIGKITFKTVVCIFAGKKCFYADSIIIPSYPSDFRTLTKRDADSNPNSHQQADFISDKQLHLMCISIVEILHNWSCSTSNNNIDDEDGKNYHSGADNAANIGVCLILKTVAEKQI